MPPKAKTRKAAQTEDVEKAAAATYPKPLTYSGAVTQLGTLGIRRMGRYVQEEYLRELQGRRGRAVYREMYNHDVPRRALRAIKLPMLAATWTAEGAEGPDAEKANEFLQQNMDDMSYSWFRTQDEIITGTGVYGASYFQVLYKRRLGPHPKDPTKHSLYDDGLWGWRKWSPRGQETWEGWEWDEDGEMTGLIQQDPYSPAAGTVVVPLDRSLHFVLEGKLGDPNGESLFRAAYEPYYGLKHADVWVAILIERMGGVPKFQVTEQSLPIFDPANVGGAALRAYVENAATAFRLDEQMGALIPWGIEFDLMDVPIKLDDIIKYINLCSWRILGSLLAQFLELGQAIRGSYAKSESDQEFFLLAEQAMLEHTIADTINSHEIPRLFGMNAGSFNLEKLPKLTVSDLQVPKLADLAEPLSKLSQGMLLTPDDDLQDYLRQIGKLPERPEEEQEPTPKLPEGTTAEGEEEGAEKGDDLHWGPSDLLT